MIKKVLVCGSGTGGHFYPALAFCDSLKKISHAKIVFVGMGKPIERPMMKDQKIIYKKLTMVSSALLRTNFFAFIFKFIWSLTQAFFLLLFGRPDVIVCFGGYTSFPIGFMGRLLFIRVVIHEQNSVMGTANRMLRSLGAECYSHYGLAGTKQLYNPLRYNIIEHKFTGDKKHLNVREEHNVILIIGGSQGASAINDVVFEIINEFMDDSRFDKWEMVHITGDRDYARGRVHGNNHHRYQCYKFLDNIGNVYAITDIAITRAGSLALSELQYYGIRKVIVPYPHASDDHQEANARYYESHYGDIVVHQNQLTAKQLYKLLEQLTSEVQPKSQLKYEDHIRDAIDEYSGEKLAGIVLSRR